MAPTGVPDDALISTFGRLIEVHARLERQLGAALERRCGLPLTWFEVLIRLGRSEDGQLTMGALADQVTLTTGGVTRLVDRMEAAGYLARLPCPTDRRVAYAVITKVGRRKLAEASEVHGANLREAFGGFSDRELTVLDRLLDRLRAVPPQD